MFYINILRTISRNEHRAGNNDNGESSAEDQTLIKAAATDSGIDICLAGTLFKFAERVLNRQRKALSLALKLRARGVMCAHLLQGPSKLYENSCEAGTEGVLNKNPGFSDRPSRRCYFLLSSSRR